VEQVEQVQNGPLVQEHIMPVAAVVPHMQMPQEIHPEMVVMAAGVEEVHTLQGHIIRQLLRQQKVQQIQVAVAVVLLGIMLQALIKVVMEDPV
jgi:hypothetical protein